MSADPSNPISLAPSILDAKPRTQSPGQSSLEIPPAPSGGADRPPITVVLATRDRPDFLRDALAAVAEAVRQSDRILVVDSASRDSRVLDVAEQAKVDLIRCNEPGTCRARNAGLAATETPLVAFTDDDCLPESGWLDAFAGSFAYDRNAAFVTGRIVAGSAHIGRAQLAISLFPSDQQAVFTPGDDPALVGHGANMAWRCDALRQIGGFDINLGPGAALKAAEDHDVVWRAFRAGFSGRFEPSAVVTHRQWRNRRAQLRAYYGYGVGTGGLAVKRARLESLHQHELSSGDPERPEARTVKRSLHEQWKKITRNVGDRYEMGAVAETVSFAGMLFGITLARRMDLVDEHFSARPRTQPNPASARWFLRR